MEEKVGGAIALVCCSLLARVMSAFFAKALVQGPLGEEQPRKVGERIRTK